MVRSCENVRLSTIMALVLAFAFAACGGGGAEASATPTPDCLAPGVMATMEEFVARLKPGQQSTARAQLTQSAPFVPADCPPEMMKTPTPPGAIAP